MSESTSPADPATPSLPTEHLCAGRVHLKPRKALPFYGRHPWVLDSAIQRIEGEPVDGDVVELVSPQGQFIARGLLNRQSRIQVRLYTWDQHEALDEAFFRRRLETALAWRQQLGLTDPAGAARVVYSEGDYLSGLVIDRFADVVAVQITCLGLSRRQAWLQSWLTERLQPRAAFLRTESGIVRQEGLDLTDGLWWGHAPDGLVFITEHGLRYGVDVGQGQKTGYYLDQRDNRVAAAHYLRGRKVLDLFCYTGGFALNAARAGASEVLGVDSSQRAIALATANAELNELTNVRFQTGEVFKTLDELSSRGEKFDAVLLDPPKFTRSSKTLDDALKAYHRINRCGVDLLKPGGILVTNSCSGNVTREDFCDMLGSVAQRTKRDLQILEQRGAAPDHPVSATCIETEYLKCFICRVVN